MEDNKSSHLQVVECPEDKQFGSSLRNYICKAWGGCLVRPTVPSCVFFVPLVYLWSCSSSAERLMPSAEQGRAGSGEPRAAAGCGVLGLDGFWPLSASQMSTWSLSVPASIRLFWMANCSSSSSSSIENWCLVLLYQPQKVEASQWWRLLAITLQKKFNLFWPISQLPPIQFVHPKVLCCLCVGSSTSWCGE